MLVHEKRGETRRIPAEETQNVSRHELQWQQPTDAAGNTEQPAQPVETVRPT